MKTAGLDNKIQMPSAMFIRLDYLGVHKPWLGQCSLTSSATNLCLERTFWPSRRNSMRPFYFCQRSLKPFNWLEGLWIILNNVLNSSISHTFLWTLLYDGAEKRHSIEWITEISMCVYLFTTTIIYDLSSGVTVMACGFLPPLIPIAYLLSLFFPVTSSAICREKQVDMRSCTIPPRSVHPLAKQACSFFDKWVVSERNGHTDRQILTVFLQKETKLWKGLFIALWSIHDVGF